MLRRFLGKSWGHAVFGLVLFLIVVWAASWLSGISGQICEQQNGSEQPQCARYNLVFVILWHIVETTNWLSPALTAIATIAIGYFTWTIWKSGEITTSLIKAQRLIEQRPRLHVRHVALAIAAHVGHPTIFYNHGAQASGGLAIVNVGGTTATIISSKYRIFFSKTGLPMKSPLDDNAHDLILLPMKFGIGHSHAADIKDTIDMGSGNQQDAMLVMREFETGGWVVYVMGQIEYADEGGNHRFMGFCRAWSGKGTFRPVRNADYEYED